MCLSIISLFCPPLAVLFKKGCGTEFWLCFLLCLLFYIPGLCYACCVIHGESEYKGKGAVITNVHVSTPAAPSQGHVTMNMYAPPPPQQQQAVPPYPQYPSHPHPLPSAPGMGLYNPNATVPDVHSPPPYYGPGTKF